MTASEFDDIIRRLGEWMFEHGRLRETASLLFLLSLIVGAIGFLGNAASTGEWLEEEKTQRWTCDVEYGIDREERIEFSEDDYTSKPPLEYEYDGRSVDNCSEIDNGKETEWDLPVLLWPIAAGVTLFLLPAANGTVLLARGGARRWRDSERRALRREIADSRELLREAERRSAEAEAATERAQAELDRLVAS